MVIEVEKKYYNVFLVEDEKTDQLAFERVIEREGFPYHLTIASSVEEAKAILQEEREFDIIILDYMLKDKSAFEIINILKPKKVPIIFHTAAGSEEIAVKALKLGVSDYLIKDTNYNYLKVLPFSIEKAIQQKQLENELRELAILHESILKSSFDAFVVCDSDAKIFYNNDAFNYLSRYSNEEIRKLNILDLLIGKEFTTHFIQAAKTKTDLMNVWTNLRPKSGSDIPVAISIKYIPEIEKTLFTIHDLRVSPEMKSEVKHFRKFAA